MPVPENHQRYDEFPPQRLYEIDMFETTHQFHPDLPPSTVWGFDGLPMGPLIKANYGEPILVRFLNNLPPEAPSEDPYAFGKPEITVHLHNAHTATESDGNPVNFFPPGFSYDNHYTMFLAGEDAREALNTLWYHDHRFDFTAQNTYKGLTGMAFFYDELDSGDENDPNPDAFHLPSGDYDVPMQFADKSFTDDVDHSLFLDIFQTDGFLGEYDTVNMAIQPFFEVEPRKYRFRWLNVGPSRAYELGIWNGKKKKTEKLLMIANDGNLLPKTLKRKSVHITVAERVDVVFDFSKYDVGDELFLVNMADQFSGKKATGTTLKPAESPQLMKFIVKELSGPDNSKVPKKFRTIPKIKESEIVAEKTFVFDNDNGIWTINGLPFDVNTVLHTVTQGTAERWFLENTSTDWEHPVHIHVEEHQIIKRNGKKPASHERGRKDVTLLGPGDSLEIVLRFRDFVGRYPIHCHNTVHEDHAMLGTWEIVAPEN